MYLQEHFHKDMARSQLLESISWQMVYALHTAPRFPVYNEEYKSTYLDQCRTQNHIHIEEQLQQSSQLHINQKVLTNKVLQTSTMHLTCQPLHFPRPVPHALPSWHFVDPANKDRCHIHICHVLYFNIRNTSEGWRGQKLKTLLLSGTLTYLQDRPSSRLKVTIISIFRPKC